MPFLSLLGRFRGPFRQHVAYLPQPFKETLENGDKHRGFCSQQLVEMLTVDDPDFQIRHGLYRGGSGAVFNEPHFPKDLPFPQGGHLHFSLACPLCYIHRACENNICRCALCALLYDNVTSSVSFDHIHRSLQPAFLFCFQIP